MKRLKKKKTHKQTMHGFLKTRIHASEKAHFLPFLVEYAGQKGGGEKNRLLSHLLTVTVMHFLIDRRN